MEYVGGRQFTAPCVIVDPRDTPSTKPYSVDKIGVLNAVDRWESRKQADKKGSGYYAYLL